MMRPDLVEQELIMALAEEGKRIIELAYATRGFTNRTYKLHDSYVSAVFKNGAYVPNTIRFVGQEMSRRSDKLSGTTKGSRDLHLTGREAADKFIKTYSWTKGRPSGIALIIAAAAYYSGIVEGRGYRVISHIETELEELRRMGLKGVKYLSHIDPEYIKESSIYYDLDGSRKTVNM